MSGIMGVAQPASSMGLGSSNGIAAVSNDEIYGMSNQQSSSSSTMPQSSKNLAAGRKESSSGQSSIMKKGGPFLLNDSSADDLSHDFQESTDQSNK